MNGKRLTRSCEVANALCKHYAAVSRLQVSAVERKSITVKEAATCHTEQEHHWFHKEFSSDELDLAIASLRNGKSAGPDGIFPVFISHLGTMARATFLKLINLTWNSRVPHQWRKAEVIPLLKGKPADDQSSYRPISLTSVCCRVAEKMVERRLREFLETSRAISDCQAGFRKHRSTTDQIVKFSQAVKDGFHRKQSTLAVLVDFKAAYDKVWRKMLLHKLKQQGVNGNMLKWIKSFLSQRFIRCKFFDSISPFRQLRQGLPQGAVLSCLLFNTMIDDLIATIHRITGVSCLLFADDVILWATGSQIKALEEALNLALIQFENWASLNKMEVSTEKTVTQLFTMSTRAHQIRLSYKGVPLQQTTLGKYFGINLDSRLSWNSHIRATAEKAHKRVSLLKRLTATKWGATQDVLATAYKSYVRPVLEYGCEVVGLASKTNLAKYDVVQNNALRLITGGAKSTPIAAMQLQTAIEPLESRREKHTLKFWERAKRVDANFWGMYKPASQRLKTQISPLTFVEELSNRYQIYMVHRAPLQHFTAVVPALPGKRLDLLHMHSSKSGTSPLELKSHALETIHTLYPSNEWLHVYTDGSYLPETKGAGAGWHCSLFENCSAVGKYASNYDGEVTAILEAANQLQGLNLPPGRVVFLIDSQAAITALSSNAPTDCLRTIQCRSKLAELITSGWVLWLQWVPSHVGVPGNERADLKARQGAESIQPNIPLTLRTAHNTITTTINSVTQNSLKDQSKGKRWECLASVGVIPSHLERAEAVARFRLATGHDYLQAHLYRIGLAADEVCPLCRTSKMDGDHLLNCPKLDHLPLDVVRRYWEARRRMAEQPRTGVG